METAQTVPTSQFGSKRTDWSAVCAEVDRLEAGVWGKVGAYHPSMVTRIHEGRIKGVDPELYMVTSRFDKAAGVHWLWMRRK